MLFRSILLTLSFAGAAGAALASGSYGGPQPGSTYDRIPQADPVYEKGKAIFNGKLTDYGAVKFCVNTSADSAAQRVTRKTLKPYRGVAPSELASHLYDCATPDRMATDVLSRGDLIAMIHFLDKRYKLKLRR
ncbi:MAG: hypothetical protein AAFX85_11195 [Pseudomonadota bacterium]